MKRIVFLGFAFFLSSETSFAQTELTRFEALSQRFPTEVSLIMGDDKYCKKRSRELHLNALTAFDSKYRRIIRNELGERKNAIGDKNSQFRQQCVKRSKIVIENFNRFRGAMSFKNLKSVNTKAKKDLAYYYSRERYPELVGMINKSTSFTAEEKFDIAIKLQFMNLY